MKIDAVVEREGIEEAEAARADVFLGMLVQLPDALVHSIDIDVGVGIMKDSISELPNAMEELPHAFDKGGLEGLC